MERHGQGHTTVRGINATSALSGPRPRVKTPHPTLSEPSATIRFDTVQMDVVEFPTVKDEHDIAYSSALSIIDMATGYPVVVPLSFNPSESHIKRAFLSHWLSLFGAPNCIISDNEQTFFLLFNALKTDFGTIIQSSAAAGHARSHGKVERAHRTIRERIVKVSASQGIPWTEALPSVLESMRFTVNSNNISPYLVPLLF